jgi:hypothetical protein
LTDVFDTSSITHHVPYVLCWQCVRACFAAMLHHTGLVKVALAHRSALARGGHVITTEPVPGPVPGAHLPAPAELVVLWWRACRLYEFVRAARGGELGETMDAVATRLLSRARFLCTVLPTPTDNHEQVLLTMEVFLKHPAPRMVEALRQAFHTRTVRAKQRATGFKYARQLVSTLLSFRGGGARCVLASLRWWGTSMFTGRGVGHAWSTSTHVQVRCLLIYDYTIIRLYTIILIY